MSTNVWTRAEASDVVDRRPRSRSLRLVIHDDTAATGAHSEADLGVGWLTRGSRRHTERVLRRTFPKALDDRNSSGTASALRHGDPHSAPATNRSDRAEWIRARRATTASSS